ncbi:hypothetical protein [Marinobacter fonticola]|uniref:hypothetical protein n=1 Tax=Marinobacter fonticola TaxID=2603215 RepID=UPI0011E83660|nr:hypothetical protein [Marinobacter fonticola]
MLATERRYSYPVAAALFLALTGCASSPPEQPAPAPEFEPIPTVTPPDQDEPKPAPEPEPAPEPRDRDVRDKGSDGPPALCAWSKVRGVASLLAQENRIGTWQFFPGDDILFHPVPSSARNGAEYRAILERPLNGPCDEERLILVAPI